MEHIVKSTSSISDPTTFHNGDPCATRANISRQRGVENVVPMPTSPRLLHEPLDLHELRLPRLLQRPQRRLLLEEDVAEDAAVGELLHRKRKLSTLRIVR